ncbi:MAG: PEP-CTERM sorting domain-containing protein [Planctomycetes bacterium]|nr:PEP-CTERM sorting domain-containing protein [Planctomycetota bacterium]
MRRAALIAALGVALAGWALAAPIEIFGLKSVSGGLGGPFSILRYDVTANSFYNCGTIIGASTNLAMNANRRIFYMYPFPTFSLYQADLDSGNNLINQVLHDTLPAGLSIIDGFTIGPNQDLYMTGYGHSEIYRYVVGSGSGSVTTEVTLQGGGAGGNLSEYRSDLAFDPLTGYLVGIGITPGGVRRSLFQIPGNLAMNGVNDLYPWEYFGGNSSPWASPTFDLGNPANPGGPLGPNPDGVAFDFTTGALYLSGDGEKFSLWDRNNATLTNYINDPSSGADTGMGFDLAFQQASDIPEPATLTLLALGGLALLRRRTRRGT